MTKYIILILLSLCTLPLFSAEQSMEKIYSLQLGAYPTAKDAQQAKKNFESQGLSPAYIIELKGQFKKSLSNSDFSDFHNRRHFQEKFSLF